MFHWTASDPLEDDNTCNCLLWAFSRVKTPFMGETCFLFNTFIHLIVFINRKYEKTWVHFWYVDLETVSCLCDAVFKSRHVSLLYDDNSISCKINIWCNKNWPREFDDENMSFYHRVGVHRLPSKLFQL